MKYLSLAYFIFTIYNILQLVLLYTLPDINFLHCYHTCNVPTETQSAVYLFLSTLMFLTITIILTFIFFLMPKEFNARMIPHKSIRTSGNINFNKQNKEGERHGDRSESLNGASFNMEEL